MNVTFGLDWALLIQLLISTILPLLVGLVTKNTTVGSVKALLLAGLAVLSSGLTELLSSINAGTPFDLGTWLITAIGSFVVAVGLHYGLWKPTTVTARVQQIGPHDPEE